TPPHPNLRHEIACRILRDLMAMGRVPADAPRSTCPLACTLDLVGDRWTLLVLRDLFAGKVCAENRRRKRYTLTESGRGFAPVLVAIGTWGLTYLKDTRSRPDVRATLLRESR